MKYTNSEENSDSTRGVMDARLLVATPDHAHRDMDKGVQEILCMLRSELQMDAVFVSEFSNGRCVFRYVDITSDQPVIVVGESIPLEQSLCQRVVDGRLPLLVPDLSKLGNISELPTLAFQIGTHIGTPVILEDGRIYGALCAFSFSPLQSVQDADLKRLQAVASMLAQHLRYPVN